MKAILFGWDRDVGLMELTYKCYMKLWYNCPLRFRIPINDVKNEDFDYLKKQDNVDLYFCKSPMGDTFEALLSDIDDDEWMFWCIGDRYPVAFHPDIKLVYRAAKRKTIPSDIESIKLFFYPGSSGKLDSKLKLEHLIFHTSVPNKKGAIGFWHHQFVKCQWFKNLVFNDAFKKWENPIRAMRNLHKIMRPQMHKSVQPAPEDNLLVLGEPAIRGGKLTMNGYQDLLKTKCKMPDREKVEELIFWPRYQNIKPEYRAIRPLELQ